METNNIYLYKAYDAYPYCLEEAVEALQYALSYEPENAQALHLMAKIHTYQLRDYEMAKRYFEATIASTMEMPNVYPDYVRALLNNEDFAEAQKLLDYAMQVKGCDKAVLYIQQGQLFEAFEEYKEAIKAFKEARKKGQNSAFINFVETEIERVKKKLPKKKKKKSKNKKKRKEKKKSRS